MKAWINMRWDVTGAHSTQRQKHLHKTIPHISDDVIEGHLISAHQLYETRNVLFGWFVSTFCPLPRAEVWSVLRSLSAPQTLACVLIFTKMSCHGVIYFFCSQFFGVSLSPCVALPTITHILDNSARIYRLTGRWRPFAAQQNARELWLELLWTCFYIYIFQFLNS